MSLEAWGDEGDGFDAGALLEAGWWDPDKAEAVKQAAEAIHREPLYEGGKKENGISTRFLMRLTILRFEMGIDMPQPLVDEARASLNP
jgi:hypothetical protein